MTKLEQTEQTEAAFPLLFFTAVCVIVIYNVWPTVGKDVGAKSQTISFNEVDSLVGRFTSQLREQFGKPDRLSFPRDYGLGNTVDLPDECWSYYRKVNHEASGKKLTLSCYVRDGKCVSVEVR